MGRTNDTNLAAGKLLTTGDSVSLSGSDPPSPGQVMMAITPTSAGWSDLPQSANLAAPNMTTAERDADFTATPAESGIIIYNTTTSKLQVSSGGAWVDLH